MERDDSLEPGVVWLAGAGPGDPGLLTLYARRALEQADAVLHDDLVSEAVLALARKGAEIEYAGKRCGKKGRPRMEVAERLIELARAGKRVLRLKGGDPCIFGRGGEEAQALAAAGVSFRVIPGVTAALGALEYAGVPPTHRAVNHAVTFVTGHLAPEARGELLDWEGIARGSPVIVLYMALGRLGEIAERLMGAGRGVGEPVVVVADATLPGQRILRTTLGEVAGVVRSAGVMPPAIVVIGQTANF